MRTNEELSGICEALKLTRDHIKNDLPGVYAPGYDHSDPKWPNTWDISNALYIQDTKYRVAANEFLDEIIMADKKTDDSDIDQWCKSRNKNQVLSFLNKAIRTAESKLPKEANGRQQSNPEGVQSTS